MTPPSPWRDRLAFALPPLLAVAIYAQTAGFGSVWDDAFLSLRRPGRLSATSR